MIKTRNSKYYVRDKILKYNAFAVLYKEVIGKYRYIASEDKLVLKNNVLYYFDKISSKKTYEEIKKSDDYNIIMNHLSDFSIAVRNLKLNFKLLSDNISELNSIINKNKHNIFDNFYFNIYFHKNPIKINEIFNSYDDFNDFLNQLDKKDYLDTVLLFKFKGEFELRFLDKILSKKEEYKGLMMYSIESFSHEFIEKDYLFKIKEFLNYIIIEKTDKKVLLKKSHMNFLIKNDIIHIDDFENREFSGKEFIAKANKKSMKWDSIEKYYTTAPKWYRKHENRKIKNKNKNSILRNISDLEKIQTLRYVRNGNYYY